MATTRKPVSLEERVQQAQELAEKSGGLLPRISQLFKHHPALAHSVYRNPEAFAHIPRQPNANRKLEEHIKRAEEIAEAHDGRLPSYTDLKEMDSSLCHANRSRPEAFEHLRRAPTFKAQQRYTVWVAEAERLAKENGGVLDCSAEFQRQHNALLMCIRNHPNLFAHIPRKRRKFISIEEHVALAEKLAAEFGGILPHTGILSTLAPMLPAAMRKNPDVFAHIKRQRVRTLRQEMHVYVEMAEKIAAENNGVLPCSAQLRRINANLYITKYRHPELFAHLPQEVRNGHGTVTSVRPATPAPVAD